MPHGAKKEVMILAASICTGYSKAPDLTPVDVEAVTPDGHETFQVLGVPPAAIKHLFI